MARSPGTLTTTGYAVLGLLALRPFTGYELTQQAKRSFAFSWLREDSLLYAQPPRLEALGFASSQQEVVNGRTRNRYSITEAGRKELSRWLATPPAPPRLELEPVLRMMFADQATPDDTRQTVQALREWAEGQLSAGAAVVDSYRRQDDPFPERRHLNALNSLFLALVWDAVLTWADRADAELDRWDPSDPGDPGAGGARTDALVDDILAIARRRAGTSPWPSDGRGGSQ
jgi:DNA-binding PadR family transcriptional regulator